MSLSLRILSDRTHKKGDGSFYVAWHWGKLDTDEDNQKTTKTVSDTLFPWNDLQAKLNGEFLNNLGNSVNRALSFIAKHMIMQVGYTYFQIQYF
ncbi:putative methionine--tRNA ligase [Arabidopsis thaliana]